MIKKAVLVTMPFIKPTSPSLGIASLKSYVETNSDAKVKCIDVNALFYNDFIDYLRNKERNSREELMACFYDFIKDKKNLEDLEILNHNITEFLEGFEDVKEKAESVSREYLEGKRNDLSLIDKYANLILHESPGIVGFSVNYVENFIVSLAMAKKLKELEPKLKIMFGGSYVSLEWDKIFGMSGGAVDYVVYNQGESALLELVRGTSLEQVPNLVYLNEGTITKNKEGIFHDLNEMPFADFSDFDLNNYFAPFPVLPVLFSKGCYWKKCSFCTHHHSYSNMYIVKRIDRFIEELGHYNKKYGTKHFYFVDEMIPATHFEKIADAITKKGMKIFYTALVKPTKDFSFKILEKMHDSGCRCLLLGVESGNQRILDLMRKGTNVKDIEEFLKLSSKAGIKNCCFFILGFPSESLDELEDTKRFILKNKEFIELVSYGRFTLEEDSPIFLNPEKFGIAIKGLKGLGKAYNYENTSGMMIDDSAYDEAKIFLGGLNKNKQCLVYLRDIMLEYYSEKG